MAPRRGAEENKALKFSRPLSWHAGKAILTSELLKRLEELLVELKILGEEQEEVHKDSLTKVAKDLASQHLLCHKDKGVRAFTACCLVDILKICAPDAPFTPSQLKGIFNLFIASILPALSNPSHAYNPQHKYVLASLAEVKSVVLLCDIPSSDSLLIRLFSSFFDMISGSSNFSNSEQIPKDVEFNMVQILVILVDEAQSLPSGVIDVIVAQFLRASFSGDQKSNTKNKKENDEKQMNLMMKELPAAYNMAKTICNSCPEKMARYVSQYFNEVIMEILNGTPGLNGPQKTSVHSAEMEDDDTPAGPTEADIKELQKAHNLLRELWRASPPVLQNVIPQLEQELSADDVQLRLLATETLGDIISGIGAAGPPITPPMDPAVYPPLTLDSQPQYTTSESILLTPISPQSFAQTYSHVYRSFASRKNDKSPIIRSAWATAVGRIITTSAGGIGLSSNEEKVYVKGLAEKLNDSDERVRLSAVKAVGDFSFRDIMSKLAPYGGVNISGSVLGSLADRARDRRHGVRTEAMKVLCRLWGVATGEMMAGNRAVIEDLGAIPTKVFDVYYANDPELNVLLDNSLFEQLIPLTYASGKSKVRNTRSSKEETNKNESVNTDKARTERILLMVKSLDAKSIKAFFAMQARQTSYAKVLEAFLSCCEDYNGGVCVKDIAEVKAKMELPIKWFAKLLPDSQKVHQDLLKFSKLHERRSYQLLRFAMDPRSDFNTVHKAIKELQKRVQANNTAPAGLLETLTPIIYRSACLIYNRSNQPILLQFARTNEHGFGPTANLIIQEISEKHPEIFRASLVELCKLITTNAPSKTKANDISVVETLKSLASFAKSDGKYIPSDKNFIEALLDFALYGIPHKAAKYAVIILAACTDRKEMYMKDLMDQSLNDWEYASSHLLTKLATINQLAALAPTVVQESSEEILDITRQLLLETRTENSNNEIVWQDDHQLDEECQAKVIAVKILVSRLQSVRHDDVAAKAFAAPVFRLLNSLIEKKGEITRTGTTPEHHRARLRLLAAQQVVKLCTIETFDKFLTHQGFYNLSYVAQDPLEDVRRGFVSKLQKYLVRNLLTHRFLTIIFITAFEPSMDFRSSIITWIRCRVKVTHDAKKTTFEATFPRLIHLLAHHPDYSSAPDELIDHARYILYYITTVASEDNLPLIYKYSQRVKQARDAFPEADSNKLYILSDLSQALIRKWEEKKGWSMQSWPKQVGLPIGLFTGLPSHEVAQQIAEKMYMPEELDPLLDGLVRDVDRKKKRKIDDLVPSNLPKKMKPDKSIQTTPVKKERQMNGKKKTPRPRKERLAPQILNTEERRRSGRSTKERKGYEERDSSEDDEEMWEGVAEWEYIPRNKISQKKVDKTNTDHSPPIPNEELTPRKNETSRRLRFTSRTANLR
ncbi:Bgt-2565 [Blumeria graminis f. sp. tritici]|uniref:Bgt-2565 n=2 Tax=Blumeria graminis f. sp. tritici TaxID=62690 RepID=A0A9X9MNW4_BLUGR|nr:hypothetical protein BGT96224_2565 [Blumeria graminis f. sp. tritici 96224]VDB93550.1 Bgt-2565 [Blumeria graminis f. sp. tritici]